MPQSLFIKKRLNTSNLLYLKSHRVMIHLNKVTRYWLITAIILSIFAIDYCIGNLQSENKEYQNTNSGIMPLSVGTKLIYEGERIFYNPAEQKTNETMAQKIAEVINIEKFEGDSLKVSIKETYKNDPDFSEREVTYLITESGFDFKTGKIILFPLTHGQKLREPDTDRDDNLYSIYVSKVYKQNILGKEYQCYDITNSTSGDNSFETFCEGIGYVRDYYEHHGTPNKSDYKLVKIETPTI